MKQVVCARNSALWEGIQNPNLTILPGPAGDEPWRWDKDPATVDGLFCSVLPENLADFSRLRWVQIDSSGFSQLIPADLPSRNIAVTNAAGVFDVPIAEWNLTMMVALARDFPRLVRNQEASIWDRSTRFQAEIRGATVGFWGYGGLARETARLAKAHGLRVHVLARGALRKRDDTYLLPGTGDPEGQLPDQVFGPAETLEFLSGLDYLIMALPLTEATRGICKAEHLGALRPTAFVLNPSRGPLIEEAALVQGLREGWFAGAALDTHYYYPLPPEHPLWKMPNVILTPHISGSTGSPGYIARVREIFQENLMRFGKDRPLINVVPADDLKPG